MPDLASTALDLAMRLRGAQGEKATLRAENARLTKAVQWLTAELKRTRHAAATELQQERARCAALEAQVQMLEARAQRWRWSWQRAPETYRHLQVGVP